MRGRSLARGKRSVHLTGRSVSRTLTRMRQQIIRLRKAQGLSVYALAKRAGVSRSYLGAIEAGTYDPTISKLVKIASGLGVDVKELL
jgi:transcriptional regulator with XRE-family HTH domain